MLSLYERHRVLISFSLSVVAIFIVYLLISGFLPSKRSNEYYEVEALYNTIDDYKTGINNWQDSKNVLIDLNYWYDLLPRYDEIGRTDSDVEYVITKIREKISIIQLIVLSKVREYYGEYLNDKLQSGNYKVVVNPEERHKIIVFTHNSFTNRKSLEKFHVSVSNELRILGFKQIRYKWYELELMDGERYIHYNFKDSPDMEIRKFNLNLLNSKE